MNAPTNGRVSTRPRVLESLPDELVASLQVRDQWRARTAASEDGLEFLVSDIARWRPGSTVRVAFLDGDAALHADIAEATKQITDACNLTLDFGFAAATGGFRRWHESDTEHAAEIRVSFDLGGFWSLVGTDSNDPTIGSPGGPVGGGPGQRSLNLGGFAVERPDDWEGVVRHEFLHALAFHHAHQNMRGPCETEFRWADDPGYLPTKNARGVFVPDAAGRRPGIYTYLAGAPNHWPKAKVDHNLRVNESPEVIAGPFDNNSVMLYAFESFFYKTNPSSCAPSGNGIDLSEGDKRGLALLYPEAAEEISDVVVRAENALSRLESGLEADTGPVSVYQERVVELLNEMVGARA
ncbi:zinc metalloprotease [Actinokineospora iranica]|uniref:Astacin (Peptidase family M12A) n=1 Tax=Actinokineospora iranica TaxID=1271860 RepID=A0A1G6RZB8_9PSEU|nr:hypothetical protein [Actinokineospora iranica]SDD09908.1 hypothetical protein SAMN05216174_107119 [Actinokineospora iranica]